MKWTRRALHRVAAALGLAILWPVFLVVAVAVKIEDWGAVFFRQERVGRGGRRFRIWKFRTMVPNAERVGLQLTAGSDPRVTRVGRWLRRLKIDELPQLLNVLAGDMNLVGPRPEVPRYVAQYTAAQQAVLDFVPGITDPGSLVFRHESEMLAGAADPEAAYVRDILPEKLRISTSYAARATTWTDAQILLLTLAVFLPGLDASVDRWLRHIDRTPAPRPIGPAHFGAKAREP